MKPIEIARSHAALRRRARREGQRVPDHPRTGLTPARQAVVGGGRRLARREEDERAVRGRDGRLGGRAASLGRGHRGRHPTRPPPSAHHPDRMTPRGSPRRDEEPRAARLPSSPHDQAVQGHDQPRRPRLDPRLGAVPAAGGADGRAERPLHRARRRRLLGDGAVGRPDRDAEHQQARRARASPTRTGTRPRCARRPARRCSPAATTRPTAWPASPRPRRGFPNSNGHIPFECATIAEVLGERGWNTYMLGKWHLVAADEMNMASTKRNWPVGPRLRALLRLPRRRDEPVVSGPRLRQPPRRAAGDARGRLPPHDRPDRQGDRVHQGREGDRARQAVLHVLLPRRHARAAPRARRSGSRSTRASSTWATRRYRELVFERQKKLGIFPDDAELSPLNPYAEEKSVDGKPWPPLDVVRPWDSLSDDEKRLFCRMAEVYAGLPLAHRPRDRAAARLPRGVRPAREHDRRPRLRQRRQRRGRPERLGQREQVLQRHPRHDRGEPAVPRRARLARDLQPLPGRLGLGVQHAVQDVEALQLRGRRRRPDGHLVAEGHRRQGRAPAPVPARHRRRADDVRPARRRAARGRQGLPADPARGRQLPLDLRERRRADAEGDRLLLDARLARDLAQGLEGGERPPDDRRLGPLRPGPLGALRHRRRTRPRATTWRPSTRRSSRS